MSRRRKPFENVTRAPDRHCKVRWRFRKTVNGRTITGYVHGTYGSVEFRKEYEALLAGEKPSAGDAAPHGTLRWLVQHYLASAKFLDLAPSTRRVLRRELDWLCEVAGQYHVADLKARHVDAIMGKKAGPAAANKVRKNIRSVINFGMKKELIDVTANPAWRADPRKVTEGGFHTWTEAEIARFRDRHPSGTKPRLVMELALNTGAARQDLATLGRQHIRADGRIEFRRGKTGIPAILRILPPLAAELEFLPADQLGFIVTDAGTPYKPASLGNWFRDRANEAQVPGTIHGLRKAAATRLSDAGATPDEIRAFLAHKTNKEGSTYTDKADRAKQADRALGRVSETENVTNLPARLDKQGKKHE